MVLRTLVLGGSLVLVVVMAMAGCAARPTESIRADGAFALRQGHYAEAAEHYGEIVSRFPGDSDAQQKLGLALMELGRHAEARQALEQAHNLQPNDENIADALAESMYRQGAQNELFSFLRERADTTRSTHAYLNLARYALEIGDMDSAQVALLTAIEVDEGRSTEPYLERAEFAARVGDSDEVIRRLRQAYGINPQDQRVLAMLREYDEVPGPTLALPPGR